MTKPSADEIHEAVIGCYGAIAREHEERVRAEGADAEGCGCGPSCCDAAAAPAGGAKTLSLGSGDPVALADPQPGETVLDLGSGSGGDCFRVAELVGPEGRVIGVDMTPDMIRLARAEQERRGARNVEFHLGGMENLPVPTATVDAVISNCVINLAPDKFAVFREAFRVLKPGGRFRVSDIVWARLPTEEEKGDLETWSRCVRGALTVQQFTLLLDAAGFAEVRIEGKERPAGRGWMSADISAVKPL